MAQITATVACAAIVERWRLVALRALFAKMVVKNRILNVTEDISEMGDILHVKINPKPTVGDITAATGAFTAEQVTIDNVDLTINKWKYVAHDVVDIAEAQADIDLVQNFSQAFVPALGVQIEDDIFALHSSITNSVGSDVTGEAFGDGVILPAILTLDDLDVPEEDRSFILPPVALSQLMKDSKFVDAHKTGLPKGVMTTGILADLYGNPTYKSSRVATSATAPVRKGLYLHKNGLMVGIQRNMKIEKFARTQFSTPFAASCLYGAAVARNNHSVVLNLKTTVV